MSSRLLPPVLLLLLSGPGLTDAGADAPKTHVLYLGADLVVEWKRAPRPVVAVRGDALVIQVDGRTVSVSPQGPDARIRLDSALKLDRDSATITGLQAERTFSADNHPDRQYETATALAQGAEAASDLALAEFRAVETVATYVTEGSGRQPGSVDPLYQGRLDAARQQYTATLHAQANAPAAAERPGTAGYDAFRLSFSVAAPRPLSRPYVIAVLRYREQAGNPKTGRVQIYAQELAAVDNKPRRVHVLRSGLPPGYELERYSLHLFDGDREIATTASAKRVELTADEAFQYALAGHLADLRSATQPPLPARDFWPADLPALLEEHNRNRLVHVRVDKAGRPEGVFHDEAARLPVTDPDIIALLPELRFLPALDRGKAVPGICRVNLGDRPL